MSQQPPHGPKTKAYLSRLFSIFQRTPDKREAHRASVPLLEDITRDPDFVTEALKRYLISPGSLQNKHYPVIAVLIDSNPYFDLVINCWLPLPDRRTDLSTKAIHHHGTMLLTTATLLGAGYEHWTFARPIPKDEANDLYRLTLLERGPHPQHHVAFVDSYIAHVPVFPRELTLTLALWSSDRPTGWRDRVKRIPLLQQNAALLKGLARKAGLTKALDLKIIEYYDFYPTQGGFKGMKERQEFTLGPNQNYLQSLCCVLQGTHNEDLRVFLDPAGVPNESRAVLESLLASLKKGEPIEGRYSAGHVDVPFANFTTEEILAALSSQ